ncbi:hypothetical protein LOZ53_001367 [Ophidiomyces ophidiicola]|nr:hypothetical protein LOZ55_003996 [Ophidiomyces ophidiicola]KAI1990306.1 hypothetical protein LOZ54_002513 [Ophidiomyces ophidiicola]KAI1995764.1 hypothetical protein LOZ53_001367 [Ophidiomyces ophidiicola]KAI1997069.1 hypothetical protein LOZ51_003232 [Ophidiomyces ophidiicola]
MAPVHFQIMSDLHLEAHPAYDFNFTQTAPYLALLGDTGHLVDDGFFEYLETQTRRYSAVFFLLGNHEPRGMFFTSAKARVRAFAERMEAARLQSSIGRFIFLDQTRYDISDTLTILGCTLFSHIPAEKEEAVTNRLADFKTISDWGVPDHNAAHQSDLNWLNSQVSEISDKEPQRQIMIFSHHSPCTEDRAVDARHRGSQAMSGFATDLREELCWKSPAVRVWAFGHTHFNVSFTDERGLEVIANQKGYSIIPKGTFNPDRVYTIGS